MHVANRQSLLEQAHSLRSKVPQLVADKGQLSRHRHDRGGDPRDA